jgi:hypothetical protein
MVNTYPGRVSYERENTMTKFFDLLVPEAQENLLRSNILDLITVIAEAIPDPDRPDDGLAMKISAGIGHDFCDGIPWIENEIDRLYEICDGADEDLSVAVLDNLLVDLNRNRKSLARIHQEITSAPPDQYRVNPVAMEIIRKSFEENNIQVLVWCHSWMVEMDDDGKIIIDVDEPLYYENLDEESRVRIQERIRKINSVIGKLVGLLMSGGKGEGA